jgi:hypothetical protein
MDWQYVLSVLRQRYHHGGSEKQWACDLLIEAHYKTYDRDVTPEDRDTSKKGKKDKSQPMKVKQTKLHRPDRNININRPEYASDGMESRELFDDPSSSNEDGETGPRGKKVKRKEIDSITNRRLQELDMKRITS